MITKQEMINNKIAVAVSLHKDSIIVMDIGKILICYSCDGCGLYRGRICKTCNGKGYSLPLTKEPK
jgi:hypothetical protein